jgi:hypothetical protein
MRLRKIGESSAKQRRIVFQHPDPRVTRRTEQTAYGTRCVTVIDVKALRFRLADRTQTLLRILHSKVVFWHHAVLAPDLSCPNLFFVSIRVLLGPRLVVLRVRFFAALDGGLHFLDVGIVIALAATRIAFVAIRRNLAIRTLWQKTGFTYSHSDSLAWH